MTPSTRSDCSNIFLVKLNNCTLSRWCFSFLEHETHPLHYWLRLLLVFCIGEAFVILNEESNFEVPLTYDILTAWKIAIGSTFFRYGEQKHGLKFDFRLIYKGVRVLSFE